MALTSLERDGDEMYAEYRPSKFGYGTVIDLDGEQCEKLGITSMLRAGQEVVIRASGVVCRSTEELEASDDSGGKDVSLSIQLTAIEIKPTGSANAARAAKMLYGESKED